MSKRYDECGAEFALGIHAAAEALANTNLINGAFEEPRALYVIDARTNPVVKQIEVGQSPAGLDFVDVATGE